MRPAITAGIHPPLGLHHPLVLGPFSQPILKIIGFDPADLADQAAGPDPVDRVNEHALADFPLFDIGANLNDLAGKIQTHDARHRHLDARHSVAGKDIMIVQR